MNTHATPASRLQHFPITFFAVVLGMGGFTLATQKASHLYHPIYPVSSLLFAVTAGLFIVISLLYLTKLIRYPLATLAEFNHPIKINFYPLIAKILLIFSIILLERDKNLSHIFWLAGSAAQFVFSLLIVSAWVQQERFKIEHLTPGWFIPIVGSIMVPIAGIPHGYTEISWFFFSVGLIFWLLLLTIVLYRIFFHAPIAERMLPTLFILFAPPAIGFIAWVRLNGGALDSLGRILYYFSLFMFFLVILQIPRLIKIRFFLSWWAYSFPLAAIALASFLAYELTQLTLIKVIFLSQFTMLLVIIVLLSVLTLLEIKKGSVCVEE